MRTQARIVATCLFTIIALSACKATDKASAPPPSPPHAAQIEESEGIDEPIPTDAQLKIDHLEREQSHLAREVEKYRNQGIKDEEYPLRLLLGRIKKIEWQVARLRKEEASRLKSGE